MHLEASDQLGIPSFGPESVPKTLIFALDLSRGLAGEGYGFGDSPGPWAASAIVIA